MERQQGLYIKHQNRVTANCSFRESIEILCRDTAPGQYCAHDGGVMNSSGMVASGLPTQIRSASWRDGITSDGVPTHDFCILVHAGTGEVLTEECPAGFYCRGGYELSAGFVRTLQLITATDSCAQLLTTSITCM